MDSGIGRFRLVAALAVALGACATPDGGVSPNSSAAPVASVTTVALIEDAAIETFPLPDITVRAVTGADLLAMLPPPGADGTTELLSNADLVAGSTFDSDDQASDVTRLLRINGATGSYPEDGHTEHVWIDVLYDADSAHRYLIDTAGDIVKGSGGTHQPDARGFEAVEFPIAVGEEAIGLILRTGEGTDATETAVLFRVGRFVGFASIDRPDDQDARVALQYLADEVVRRIVDTLATGDPSPPRADLPPYRFETTVTIDGAERWTIESQGIVSAAGRSCIVRQISPNGELQREIVESDGALFWRHPDDPSWSATGSANQTLAALLARCPSWPLDLRQAGFADLGEGEGTPHMVNGVASIGYRADVAGLEAALGVTLPGVTIDTFAFWIADSWLVELSITATGDAAVLAPLTGPGFEGDVVVTLRHRVFDINATDEVILPPG
jgi:hypothetical protein